MTLSHGPNVSRMCEAAPQPDRGRVWRVCSCSWRSSPAAAETDGIDRRRPRRRRRLRRAIAPSPTSRPRSRSARVRPARPPNRRLTADLAAQARRTAGRRGRPDPAAAAQRRRRCSPAAEPGYVVLGAHHDTKDGIPGFVGANDGASGVAVVLELARVAAAAAAGPVDRDRPLRRRGGPRRARVRRRRQARQHASTSSYARGRRSSGIPPLDEIERDGPASTWSATATSTSRARRTPTTASTRRFADGRPGAVQRRDRPDRRRPRALPRGRDPGAST